MSYAERTVFFEIPLLWQKIFYVCAAMVALVFIAGVFTRLKIWKKGKPASEDKFISGGYLLLILRIVRLFFSSECLFAKRVREKSPLRATMLVFVYWGFTVLLFGTSLLAIDHDLKLHFLKGSIYLIYSFVLDLAGIMLLIGTAFYILRRIFRPKDVLSSAEDYILLILLFLVTVTGFSVEGARLAINSSQIDFAPIGYIFAAFFKGLLESSTGIYLYRSLWAIHILLALTLIAYIPFSKLFHVFAAQLSTAEAKNRQKLLERYGYE